MKTTILMEFRKFFSTRMWWILLAAMVVYMALLAGVMALTLVADAPGGPASPSPDADPVATARSIYTIATSLGYAFPAIIGALSVTGEFRHKTMTPTLLAEPNRTRLIGAKLLAAIPMGIMFGIAGTASGVVGGGIVLQVMGDGAFLGDPTVWGSIGSSVLALTLWTMIGVGLGTLLTSQVAVIVSLLAFTQFVEPAVRALLSTAADGRFSDIAAYLPGSAGEAITGASIYSAFGDIALLPMWVGVLTLTAYTLVFAGLGRVITFRRDLT